MPKNSKIAGKSYLTGTDGTDDVDVVDDVDGVIRASSAGVLPHNR